MKVIDKELGVAVSVFDLKCLKRECYWPRPDPGVFTPGRGYKTRGNKPSSEYICGTRDIHGCPDEEL
jgi:hypothetical protein